MKSLRATATLLAALVPCQWALAQTVTPATDGKDRAVLERVVIVERHGVRPPTKAPEELAKFAEEPWPQWSVKPGELTDHGAKAITIMGAALKRVYAQDKLLAASGCPAGVFVWSDSGDQRTRASGDAVLKGFGCTAPSSHLAAGESDPLFDPIESGICPVDPQKGKAAAEARLATLMSVPVVRTTYLKARTTMQSILTPHGCGKDGQPACLIGEGEDKAVIKNGDAKLDGPLANASGLTENLLLEYSEGMPLSQVGWGRAAGKLDEVLQLHNLYANVMRSDPYFASRRGSLLAQQVIDILNDKPSTFKGAAPVPKDAKLVLFLGHDTNLSNMAGFLNASWTLNGQPDNTAPDEAIAFERWRKADGSKFVTVKVYYQKLEETRALTALDKPNTLTLCDGESCPLAELSQRLTKTIAPDCIQP